MDLALNVALLSQLGTIVLIKDPQANPLIENGSVKNDGLVGVCLSVYMFYSYSLGSLEMRFQPLGHVGFVSVVSDGVPEHSINPMVGVYAWKDASDWSGTFQQNPSMAPMVWTFAPAGIPCATQICQSVS